MDIESCETYMCPTSCAKAVSALRVKPASSTIPTLDFVHAEPVNAKPKKSIKYILLII